jgi:NAD(P)-dependent dehydrogenase (short-subunit alcohol dehydrogenase family)
MRFDQKIAVVTGADSGIGRSVATRLLREGASVVAIDLVHRTPWPSDLPRQPDLRQWDVASLATPGQLEELLRDEYGTVDILANVVGILRIAPFLEVTREDWDQVIDVNLTATFFLTQAVGRVMVEKGVAGRIVNVSSVHAVVSEPNAAPYTATKGGLEAMSRTLASELASAGITVNCVRPGATRTAMSKPIYTPEVLHALMQRVPMGMVAEPEWVASAICYLASDEARYTTGACLDVDGGYSMDGSLPGLAYARTPADGI